MTTSSNFDSGFDTKRARLGNVRVGNGNSLGNDGTCRHAEWDNKPITQSEQRSKIRETFGDRIIFRLSHNGRNQGSIEERVTETLDAGVDYLFSNGSDAERRRAVTASGGRVTREDPSALSFYYTVLQQLLKKLAK